MTETFPNSEQINHSPEAIEQASLAVASALHEDWRKTQLQDDGSFEPKFKETKDEAWIATQGTDMVDIANTTFQALPSDWQAENHAAAEVVVGILAETNGIVDLDDETQRDQVGSKIHDEWLSRNEYAKGGELDVPFTELSPAEQAKDLDQMVIAQQVLMPRQ